MRYNGRLYRPGMAHLPGRALSNIAHSIPALLTYLFKRYEAFTTESKARPGEAIPPDAG